MNKGVLDTDTLSYALDRRYPEVNAAARQYERVFRFFTITAVTMSEVIAGYTKSRDHAALGEFLKRAEGFEILPLDEAEAIGAGRIIGELRRTGTQIGPHDPFIAAIAIENGLPLITNNTAHYQRIIDLGFPLRIENWKEP